MDFASNLAKNAQPNNPQTSTNDPDLFSSAKVVAGAAQSQFRSEEYDREKAAGAGADLLNSASDYAKLDNTQGIGKYADQAEGYLRQYDTKSTNPTAAADETTGTKIAESEKPAPAGDLTDAVEEKKSTLVTDDGVKTTTIDHSAAAATDGDDSTGETIKTTIPTGDFDEPSADGVEDYVKKGEGFLSKESGAGGEEEKTGDYNSLKEEAEGALKKLQPGEAAEDYVKQEEGVFGKPSAPGDEGEKTEVASDTQSGGGAGFGNVMKIAGGFLKK